MRHPREASRDTHRGTTYQVNPPYTPKIKRLILGYRASVTIALKDYKPGSQPERLWHIHPFGYHEVQPEARTRQYLFLPQYDNEANSTSAFRMYVRRNT